MAEIVDGAITQASDLVTLTVADGVAVLSLIRPERHNAIDDDLHEELLKQWASAADDSDVRVILLRGEGPSFCSGRDTSQLGQRVAGESDLSFVRRHQQSRVAQLSCPKPVVAAVRGHALGGGLELALVADLRIVASDVRMAFPEISYGLMTDTGGAPLATTLIGPARTKWMLMSGRVVEAQQALEWGLADEVVSPDELDARALAVAKELATKPTEALAMIKATVDGMWHAQVHAGLRSELLGQVALFAARRGAS